MFKYIMIVIAFFAVTFNVNLGLCQSKFQRHTLSDGITVQIPNNWQLLSSDTTSQLDTNTEVVTGTKQGNNKILIAANCYTNTKKASATMRISVRYGPCSTQQDIANIPESRIVDDFKSNLRLVKDMLRKVDPTADMEIVSIRKRNFSGYISIEAKHIVVDSGVRKLQTLNIVNLGNRRIKIMTTYALAQESLLKLTVSHIEDSITIR